MAIGFAGIGAGADWNSIIEKLLEIESRPLEQLRTREQQLNFQISSYGRVKSSLDKFMAAVDGLRTQADFAPFTGTTTDENVITAEAGVNAAAASFDVVVSDLATYDKIASSAYADSNTAVGTGTLSITVNGDTLDLVLDGSNNTLADIRDAINSASDNPGVSASILNEAGGSRLILTGKQTGAANAINISFSDTDDGNNTDENGLSKLFYVGVGDDGYAEQVSTAQDAQLTIDGFDITSASNTVTDAVTGVSLKLVAAGSATVGIVRDDGQIAEQVGGFVDAYNTLRDELRGYANGALKGDSSLRSIESGLVAILNQSASINGVDVHLFEAGITRDRTGRLSLDSAALTDGLDQDFEKIISLFSDSTSGFASRFYDYADELLKAGGVVNSREEGLSSRVRSLQTQIERQELHLDVVEKTLIKQFSDLDQTVATLQGTSNYLAGQMGALLG